VRLDAVWRGVARQWRGQAGEMGDEVAMEEENGGSTRGRRVGGEGG
jgi:hypothetical protein